MIIVKEIKKECKYINILRADSFDSLYRILNTEEHFETKDIELCLKCAKSGKFLIEAHCGTVVQIVRYHCIPTFPPSAQRTTTRIQNRCK